MKSLKSLLFSSIMAFSLVLTSCAQSGDKGYTDVKVIDLKEKLGTEITILDVRTPNETNQGHVEGAILIDYFGDNFIAEVNKLDKEKPIYVHCKVGGRSAKASKLMIENGFKHVYNVDGGFDAWKDAKYPIVKK
jgi:phage shock protein E